MQECVSYKCKSLVALCAIIYEPGWSGCKSLVALNESCFWVNESGLIGCKSVVAMGTR